MSIRKTRKVIYGDYIYAWLQEKKYFIKESTYANYSGIIFNHIIPSLGAWPLNQLNHKLIQNYLLELIDQGDKHSNKALSIKSVKDIAVIIKASIHSAIVEGLMPPIDLCFKYPKVPPKERIYTLTKLEQSKITNYAIGNLNPKNIGLLLTLYSGLRIGEICALQWKDVDFKKCTIRVNKTLQRVYFKDNKETYTKIIVNTPKTMNSIREIPVNRSFLAILKDHKTANNDYIITGTAHYLEPRTYRRYFDRVLKRLRIKHINFHALRHTFATNCIALGVDYKTVSEILGHANVNITLNLYVHPRIAQKKKCIDLVSKVLQEKII